MEIHLVHYGRLPSMNEMLNANRTNRYIGAKIKAGWTHDLAQEFKIQAAGRKMERHATCHITFYERDAKRDDDNVVSGSKFVLDALTMAGIIEDDSPKFIHMQAERFTLVGKKADRERLARIEVYLEESDEEVGLSRIRDDEAERPAGLTTEEVCGLWEDLHSVEARPGNA